MKQRRPTREERPELPLHRRELIDAADVGRLLGCGRSTVLELRRTGFLPKPLKLAGGLVRWRVRELADWIDAGCPFPADWRWEPSIPVRLQDYIALLQRRRAEIEEELAEVARRVVEAGGGTEAQNCARRE